MKEEYEDIIKKLMLIKSDFISNTLESSEEVRLRKFVEILKEYFGEHRIPGNLMDSVDNLSFKMSEFRREFLNSINDFFVLISNDKNNKGFSNLPLKEMYEKEVNWRIEEQKKCNELNRRCIDLEFQVATLREYLKKLDENCGTPMSVTQVRDMIFNQLERFGKC
jgi:hypothetical protein